MKIGVNSHKLAYQKLEKDIEKAVQQVEPNKSELTQEQMSHLFNMMTIFSILPQTESKNI
jgi:hypothetical protein